MHEKKGPRGADAGRGADGVHHSLLTDDPFRKVIERLGARVKKQGDRTATALCPAHGDHNPSLSIKVGDDGRVLLHCHGGCPFASIVAALGLEPRDLFPQEPRWEQVANYWYHDQDGKPVFQKIRWRLPDGTKAYSFRKADGTKGMGGKHILYQLPALLKAERGSLIFVAEGEKCVDRLTKSLGLLATCNPCGAKLWTKLDKATRRLAFAGQDVVALQDNDEEGLFFVQSVGADLFSKRPIAKRVRILPPEALSLTEKGDDVVDWYAQKFADRVSTKEEREALREEFLTIVEEKAEVWSLQDAGPETLGKVGTMGRFSRRRTGKTVEHRLGSQPATREFTTSPCQVGNTVWTVLTRQAAAWRHPGRGDVGVNTVSTIDIPTTNPPPTGARNRRRPGEP